MKTPTQQMVAFLERLEAREKHVFKSKKAKGDDTEYNRHTLQVLRLILTEAHRLAHLEGGRATGEV